MDVRREIASVRSRGHPSWDAPGLTKLGEFGESLSSIAGDVLDLQEQLTRLREESEELEKLLDDRQAELAESELIRTRLADECAVAQEDRTDARASLDEAAAQLELLRGAAASVEDTLSQRTHELADSELARARLADECAVAEEDRAEARASLDEAAAQLELLRGAAASVEDTLSQRTHELADSELARARLADECAVAEEDRAEARASLDEAAAQLELLRGELASVEDTLSQRTLELAESQRLRARLTDDVAHAREGWIETRAALAHAETQLDAREARVAALDDEVRSLKLHLPTPQRIAGAASEPEPALHLQFVPQPEGYALSEIPGPPPKAGERVEVGRRRFRVARVGRSPLPDDARPCAFLLLEAELDSPPDDA